MRAGLLAFGTLLFAAPAFAQAGDPLAPLPTTGTIRAGNQPASRTPRLRSRSTISAGAAGRDLGGAEAVASNATAGRAAGLRAAGRTVAIPKDWRGVFDAIDAGNWASAQAGIAALPPGVLTAEAKAELYTAKGSPTVDLASLQALIAAAPELPQANQLALMAIKRGRTPRRSVIPERATVNLGSAPVRYRAGRCRASPPPISCARRSIR